MTRKFLLFALMIVFTFSMVQAKQTMSVKELTNKAESIVIGKVAEQQSEWNSDKTQIYTTVTFDVHEYLKGSSENATKTFRIPGGQVGDIRLQVAEMPDFKTGEKALLFLKKGETPDDVEIVGLKQGKFSINKNRVVENNKSLLELKKEIIQNLGDDAISTKKFVKPERMKFPNPELLEKRAREFKPTTDKLGEAQLDGVWGSGYNCIWKDDFEGEFPGTDWVVAHNANPGVNNGYTWGKTNVNPFEGGSAVWCAQTNMIDGNQDLQAGTDAYPNNSQSWMIAGPFDLSEVYSARLTFNIDQTVEPWRNGGPNDWTGVGFSVDGVWFELGPDYQFFYHSTDGYIDYAINIEDVIGPLWDKTQVWICFIFWTDYMNADDVPLDGTWVDNVKLKKYDAHNLDPVIYSVEPDVRPAGTGYSVTINGKDLIDEYSPERTTVEFFSGFYWWDDSMWVQATDFDEFTKERIVVDVPTGASSGKLRILRDKEGDEYADINVPFGYIGARWHAGVGNAGGTEYPIIPFKVNPFTCPHYNTSDVLADIVGSAETWNTDGNAMVYLQFDGVSSVTEAAMDGENSVLFAPITHIPFGVPALTYIWSQDGKILEADIVMNVLFPWAHSPATASGPAMITANFATNEFGNLLGLTDLYGFNDQAKTMFGYHDLWGEQMALDVHAVDLHPEDIEGVQWIYGTGLNPDFVANNRIGISPLTVQFTDRTKTIYPITGWLWEFGDGSTSTEQNPVHTFVGEGDCKFDVKLTVTSDAGGTTLTKSITENDFVQLNVRVAASVDAEPTVGYGPLSVQFNMITEGTVDSYLWDFGDGETSEQRNPVHVYENPGIYTVSVTASGPMGSTTETVAGLVEVYDDMEALGLTYLTLAEANGTTWHNEGWDNAVDHDTYHTTGATNVRSDGWAVFTFDDGFTRTINKVRLMTDTGVQGKENDWVTKFSVAVSTDGENYTDVGTFTKSSPNWEAFTFEPVEALFVKLTILSPASGWRQIGEFEVYEQINVPDISGSFIVASTPHVANGYDHCSVTIALADADGNPVTGLSPSYFRVNATGMENYYNIVTETETPGIYLGSFKSLAAEEKNISVRVGGIKIESSTVNEITPVNTEFTPAELTKDSLVVHSGTKTWHNEGWDKAVDGILDNQTAAAKKYSGCYGIYKFADDGERAIVKTRFLRGSGHDHPEQLVKEYRISTSMDGVNFTELAHRTLDTNEWVEKMNLPVVAKYIKLELLDADSDWRQFAEFEVYTTPLIGAGPVAMTGGAFNKSANAIPTKFDLNQNYPNPFNPETMISFDLPENAKVTLQVYNMLGQVVQTLVSEKLAAGSHKIMWNGQDEHGVNVASGVYFYRIKAIGKSKEFNKKMKMTLIR